MSTIDYPELNLILNKHFRDVLDYCKKEIPKKKLPAYLLLGTQHSGKSSLIKKSSLKLKSIPATPPQNSHSEDTDTFDETKNCYWYIHDNCIFIDTPGDYASSEVSDTLQTPWRCLIDLLVQNYQTFPIKNILVTVSIYDLLCNSKQTTRMQLHLLKTRILDLKKFYGEKLPLSILFTKWDAVVGFNEFFDTLTGDERKQVFGILFKKKFTDVTVTHQFNENYKMLLQQLSQMLIMRMHTEHNVEKRAHLSQFPLQMEQLQPLFMLVVSQLMEKTYDCDASIPTSLYFTCAVQKQNTLDILSQKLQTSFNLPASLQLPHKHPHPKDFFIQDLFESWSQCEKPTSVELTVTRKGRIGMMTLAALLVIGFAGFILTKLTLDIKKINTTETNSYALSLLNNASNNPEAKNQAAKKLAEELNHTSNFWLGKKIVLNSSKASVKATNMLDTTSSLQAYLETILTNPNTPPTDLYSTLKAYLMFAGLTPLEHQWLRHWLRYSIIQNNILDSKEAKQYLSELQKNHPLYQAKQGLIDEARKQLSSLPSPYLAYILLQSLADYRESPQTLNLTLGNKSFAIPFIFTAQGLQTLFLNNLHAISVAACRGDTVTGKIFSNVPVYSNSVREQLIALYVTNYVNWWTNVFNGVEIPDFNNLIDLNQFIATLGDPQKGLVYIYKIISQNTDADKLLPSTVNDTIIQSLRSNLSQQVKSKLSILQQLDLAGLQSAFDQYSGFLNNLVNSKNIKESAFLMIKHQFETPDSLNVLSGFKSFAGTIPEPLKTSLTHLSDEALQLTIQSAMDYLQTNWDNEIVAFYNQYLENRYPLFPQGEEDISLENFTQFFSPTGILQTFFNNYLVSFIDTNQSDWELKSVQGIRLPLHNQLLVTLEKGQIITAMFFPQNASSIQVNFTLQQIALMPIVHSFELNMDGQSLHDERGSRNINTFIWPGNSNVFDTQLSLDTVNGQHMITKREGFWSWFRLLESNTLHTDKNSQEYTVTFDIDGNEARYHLTANNPINPFIPGIIDTFRVPKEMS